MFIMARLSVCVFIVACGLAVATAASIEPKLEPKSSKKFFGKDLPTDAAPVTGKHSFEHPYPAVQDTDSYDTDFVKDQNQDNGEWGHQMQYDILRQKVFQAQKELAALKKAMGEEESDMKETKKEWQSTVHEVEEAKAASAELKKAEAAADAAEKASNAAVKKNADEVEKEMSDLKKCTKNLADAEQKLKDLVAKQEAAEQKAEEAKVAAAKAAKDAEEAKKTADAKKADAAKKVQEEEKNKVEIAKIKVADARKKVMESMHHSKKEQKAAEDVLKAENKARQDLIDQKKIDIETYRKEMEAKEVAWTKKLNQETAELDKATKDFEAKEKAMKETEANLEKAKTELKKFRREPFVDDDGGVYNVPKDKKSSAQTWQLSAVVVVATLALAF